MINLGVFERADGLLASEPNANTRAERVIITQTSKKFIQYVHTVHKKEIMQHTSFFIDIFPGQQY